MAESSFTTLVGLFAAGLFACLLLTPLVRSWARHLGLVDKPDGRRKIHKSPIPVAGGVAIFVSASLVLGIAYFILRSWSEPVLHQWRIFVSLFFAASVLAVVGVIDDYRGMRGRFKLLAQVMAVFIVISGGVLIRNVTILGQVWDLGWFWGGVLTMFWLLGAINSLNLIDGIDGLLGSIGFILCLTIGGMAFLNGNFAAACIAVTLAGALLAFLSFNFPPASIFLGDAGSMLIGLVVGTLAIQASLKGPATVALAAPVALMIIPIFDTSAAIIRRKMTGRSFFTTDRGHLHHVLLRGGFSNRKIVLVIGVLSVILGAAALWSAYVNNEVYAVGAAITVVVFLLVSRLFGYAELLIVKQRLLAMVANVRHGHIEGRIQQIKVHLQGSADWNSLWRELTRSAEELQLKTMTLNVNAPALHEGFHARWERSHSSERAEMPHYWRVDIPLTVMHQVMGSLEVVGLRDEDSAWQKLSALAKIIEGIELFIAEVAIAKEQSSSVETPVPVRSAEGLQLERA